MKLALAAALLAIAGQGVASSAQPSTVQATNDAFVKRWMEQIAGRESEPAERVFKNVQWLKTTPASTFLRIMNGGYARALGVTCTHCHVETDFSSDDKRPKRAAREMAAMHRMINERLRQMENLQTPSADRAINCSTCHRGVVNPLSTDK